MFLGRKCGGGWDEAIVTDSVHHIGIVIDILTENTHHKKTAGSFNKKL